MELKEMIKVMQHYADGGEVEMSIKGNDNWVSCSSVYWNWYKMDYRKKEQKQKVTIEKWLCESSGVYVIIEASDIHNCYDCQPVKLLETYEVEL